MNITLHKISLYILYFLPISLITGPAIPDISISLICIFFLIYTFKNNEYGWLKENWIRVGLIFWLSLCFISFFSLNKSLSFSNSIIFIRLILFSIAIYYWLIKSKDQYKTLMIIVFFSTIFIIIDSLIQFSRYDPLIGYGKDIFGFIPTHYQRLTGPFDEQVPGSHLSKFFFVSILLFIYFFKNNKINSTIFFIYILLNGLTIFVSGEKMALATFLLGCLIFLIIFKEYRKYFLSSLIILAILTGLLIKNHKSYNDFKIIESKPFHLGLIVEKKFECIDNTNEVCTKKINVQPEFLSVVMNFKESIYAKIYTDAYRMWLDNKITGIGLNNFEYVCEKNEKYRTKKINYGDCSSHPHNFYLQWLVESGLIGFILFLLFIATIFKKIISNLKFLPSKIGFISLVVLFC